MRIKDSFGKKLVAITIPVVLQNLLSTAVSSADIVMLSYVDQNAMSAVSLAGQVTFLLNLFFSGITIGTTTLASQFWGKHDRGSIRRAAFLSVIVSVAISSIFGMTAVFAPEWLMGIFTNDAELIAYGVVYLRIIGFSYFIMGVSQIYLCILKSVQQVARSTAFSSITLLLNVFLNALLIFGWLGLPRLGIYGVAYGTLIARAAELLFCILDAVIAKKIRFPETDFLPGRGMVREFSRITFPVTAEGLVWGGATAALSAIMGRMGADLVAANSVASMANSFATVACFALATAGTILLGEELGQSLFEHAKRHADALVKFALAAGALGAAVMLLCYPLVLRIVELNDAAQQYLAAMFVILAVKAVLSAVTNMMICGIFSAGGDTRFGLLCDIFSMWTGSVLIGSILCFVLHAPPLVVYLGMNLDELLKLPFVIAHYRKKKWLRNITLCEENE